MRVETPAASGFYISTRRTRPFHDVSFVSELWGKLAELAGQVVELKSGDWVLEDVSELTSELIAGNWTLHVRFNGTYNYLTVGSIAGVLELSGARSADTHQIAAQIKQYLTSQGYVSKDRFIDASSALLANKVLPIRTTPKKKKSVSRATGGLSRTQRFKCALENAIDTFTKVIAVTFAISAFRNFRHIALDVTVVTALVVLLAFYDYKAQAFCNCYENSPAEPN